MLFPVLLLYYIARWKIFPFTRLTINERCSKRREKNIQIQLTNFVGEWEMHKLPINFMTNSLLLSCFFSYGSLIKCSAIPNKLINERQHLRNNNDVARYVRKNNNWVDICREISWNLEVFFVVVGVIVIFHFKSSEFTKSVWFGRTISSMKTLRYRNQI